jgi:hypothetical protein
MSPSTTIICPVTQPASSLHRKATGGAMSSGSPRRGIAWSCWTNSYASLWGVASTPSVAVSPGATPLTVIPSLPSSVASARVNPNTPPLADTYAAMFGVPASTVFEITLTIRP